MEKLMRRACLLLLLAFATCVRAEDIDLFVGRSSTVQAAPNVLIILDNTANWSTPFASEIGALSSVVGALQADQVRLGLMLFTESGGGNSGSDGAYVRAAIRGLSADHKVRFQALVNSLERNADKSNGGKASKAMWEAYQYFSGGTPHAGNNKEKTDYTGNTGGTAASNAIYAQAGNALSAKAATRYVTPVVEGCAKNYIIYISNGAAQDNSSDLTQAGSALQAAGGSTSTITLSPNGSQNNYADEWARFMKGSQYGITTYTIDINKVTNGQGPGWTALLKSMARVSGGKYFDVASSGSQIADALGVIFSEIQSTNSVFASVSLPVSVNTQGTYLNQVYVGMFRPDEDAFPRWFGNLKQYKLGKVNGELRLVDANSRAAINSSTGFVTECARSFWTPSTADAYWAFSPRGDCAVPSSSTESNSPDGNIVEKGGQAFKLRATTPDNRSVYTCSPVFATCSSRTALGTAAATLFNTTNTAITSALLGTTDSVRSNLINWTRGRDIQDEDGDADVTEARASAHGDVVHSRPAAINYGTDSDPAVVVFYGGNDGLLRAVNGNRSGTVAGQAPGGEIWSFMPPEFYGNLKRLYDNVTPIRFAGNVSTTPTPLPKAYGMDGPVAAWHSGDNAWIYASMRRGGRVLYAFDVSTASAPVLKWKVGCPSNFPATGTVSDTDCTSGFSGIGQTWSTPQVFTASGYGSGASPVLVMGGGYDPCEDADPHTCTGTSKGNKIYVLDADTGTRLKTFDTERSVVGDVTVVKDSHGRGIYAYAADMGGNVYRIAMGQAAPADWTMTRIAALGCATPGTACTANRKFMFAPDVLSDNGGYVILLGSGDREKPLASYTAAAGVTNYFFMLRDYPANTGWLTQENATCGANLLCLDSLMPILSSSTPTTSQLQQKKGWYLGLNASEQVVTSSITVYGVVTFSTHAAPEANPSVCASLGETRVYNVNYRNAAGSNGQRWQNLAGDGLPPSPVAGIVALDDGSLETFIIGASADSGLEGSSSQGGLSVSQPTSRVYWNIEN